MTTSVYVPPPVADEIDRVHEELGKPEDAKWRTIQRAVYRFVEEEINE